MIKSEIQKYFLSWDEVGYFEAIESEAQNNLFSMRRSDPGLEDGG